MSQVSQPSAVISARLIGRKGAALDGVRRREPELRGFSAYAWVSMAPTHKAPAPRIQSVGRLTRACLAVGDGRAGGGQAPDRVPGQDDWAFKVRSTQAVSAVQQGVEIAVVIYSG